VTGTEIGAMRRAALIDSLDPLWIVGRLHIQKMEVENFASRRFFDGDGAEIRAVAGSVTQILYYDLGRNVPLGWRACDYIADLLKRPGTRADIAKGKQATPEALSTLQSASASRKKAAEPEIFRLWIQRMLPRRHPAGRMLTTEDRAAILQFCTNVRRTSMRRAPAMAVESELTRIRSQDPGRHPETQDATDFQHSVVGLAYCEHFVCRDKYVRTCAEQAVKALADRPLAKVWNSISALP
jgi:hypothetical protein